MVVAEIKLYELLKTKIGQKEAEAFVEILDKKVENKFNDKKGELATKEDLASLRLATKEDLSAFRSEILRTVYLTSLGQLLAIVASVIAILTFKK
jgi:hypothetical protein